MSTPWEWKSTFLTNATNDQRPYYEEAIKRYQGPGKIEIHDEAFLGGGLLYPECFSVHITNNPENGPYELGPFWKILAEVRAEIKAKQETT